MNDALPFGQLWVYLAKSPLLGLTLTVCAYLVAQWLHRRCGQAAWANPVAISVAIVATVLAMVDMSYADYFSGAQFVHFLLGPATVALAIPLARLWPRLRAAWRPLSAGLLAGSMVGVLSGTAMIMAFSSDLVLAMSMAPKSSTSPIAMSVAESLGGLPALAVSFALLTGMTGAICGVWVLQRLRVDNPMLGGLALGVASHGIGTARAFQVSLEMGAFAGLGMGLNGILTAVITPWMAPLIARLFT